MRGFLGHENWLRPGGSRRRVMYRCDGAIGRIDRTLGNERPARGNRLSFRGRRLRARWLYGSRNSHLPGGSPVRDIRRTYAFTFRNDSLFTASEDYIANSVGLMTPFNRGHVVIEGTTLRIAYPWIGAADEPITRIDQFTREGCVRISLKWCV